MEEKTIAMLIYSGLFLALAAFVAYKAEKQEEAERAQGKERKPASHSSILL